MCVVGEVIEYINFDTKNVKEEIKVTSFYPGMDPITSPPSLPHCPLLLKRSNSWIRDNVLVVLKY